MSFDVWQWCLAAVAAIFVGLSKTAVGGLGLVSVAVFANLMPAREASGFVLPLLICADAIAVLAYRRHTQWVHLVRLFPWTGLGVLLGWFALGRINDAQASILVGTIILAMVAIHVWRRRKGEVSAEAHGPWFGVFMGVLAGFTTLIANAAGPLMALYLLAMRLPKMEFVGTAAYFFFLLNLFKVPFMINLGLIDARSITGNLVLVPAVIAGAIAGRLLLTRINQKLFEHVALALSALAGLKLLW